MDEDTINIELIAQEHQQRYRIEECETSFIPSTQTLISMQPPEEDRRLKTRLLTYARQNYLFLIKTLLLTIFLLLLVILYQFYYNAQNHQVLEDIGEEQVLNQDVENSTVAQIISDEHHRRDPGDDNPSYDNIDKQRPCSRIHCKNSSCYPSSVEYTVLREYTCCHCYDSRFLFRRYTYDLLRDSVSLQFQVPEDIQHTSARDLENMAQLPNLNGGWNMISESPTAHYFVYQDVTIPEPVDE